MTSEQIYQMADTLTELAGFIEKEENQIADIRWDLNFKNWLYYNDSQRAELIAKLHRSIQIIEATIDRLKTRVKLLISKN